jgi:hypothetical protein
MASDSRTPQRTSAVIARSRGTIAVASRATSSAPSRGTTTIPLSLARTTSRWADREPTDLHRLASATLLQAASRRHRDRAAGEDGETQLTSFGHVATHPVGHHTAHTALGGAEAQHAAPARHVGAALVDTPDLSGLDGHGGECAGLPAVVRLESNRDREPDDAPYTPQRPDAADPGGQVELVERITHRGRVQFREQLKKGGVVHGVHFTGDRLLRDARVEQRIDLHRRRCGRGRRDNRMGTE